jgi:dihydroorotate dehydrogenase electron transfer subunit
MVLQSTATVLSNEMLGETIFKIRVEQPAIAREISPGQFAMLRPHGRTDPLLGRPLAMYDVGRSDSGEPTSIDFVYLVQGNGTRALASLGPGDRVDLWGPLGNSFPRHPSNDLKRVLLLAGGIGQTPFLSVAKDLLGQQTYGAPANRQAGETSVSFIWGVRTKSLLAGLNDFQTLGIECHVATDDGSAGHHGRVTDLARQLIERGPRPTAIFSCGPEPMLVAVARLGQECQVPTWVSLETRMACGYGVCFSCVCPVKDSSPAGWDYSRVCLEGPIFRSTAIEWNEIVHQ